MTRSMLRDQVKDALVERILDGVYGPGDRIVEMRVAEEFGVSQAPVREALRELELLRLVVSEPFRGARVREVTAEELREIYPVRAALEEVAARSATPTLAGDVKPLEAELAAMRRAARQGDVHAFIAHDVAFHRIIVEASGNRTLQELWRSLHVELRTTITLIKHAAELAEAAESHLPVLEAIDAGDAERAAAILRGHIEAFAAWIPSEP
ncbi:GntR family transcriptional regulator [Candidatus Solirubrobacter pratensis]|uniref:GntR family transcriptional regulator n=1 Tax=Candidatus Solirubrobacter pratensis TaxID=1298857 RepID=UPI001E305337|nr:GntR family transcriptional regulator [Candidatus Solirubrobacter pratensis]